MAVDMNQELLKRLDALAEKLGTTGAMLWDVMIRQARVELVSDALFMGLNVLFVYLLYKWWKRVLDNAGEGEAIGSVIVSIVVLVFTIANVCELVFYVPTLLFNPKYWAFQQIMDKLK
jgi:hypothetical protein